MVSDVMLFARSLAFNVAMYVVMAALALGLAPLVLLDADRAFWAIHLYCRYVRWSARRILGLRTEIRGAPPEGEVLVAAKHQSFLDIILIVSALPRPRFIMKKELLYAPFVGWYAKKIGCIPVDRGRRGKAIDRMIADVGGGRLRPGQLIIYPQGTRVAPGVQRPYKIGTAVLYEQLGQPCVPVATNVGVYWPRRGFLRRPGVGVVEFLPPIPPGLSQAEFMERLENAVETASDRLLGEAGFVAPAASSEAPG